MRVLLVCGDRHWFDEALIEEEIRKAAPDLVIHGAARGADYLAGKVARRLGIKVEEFRANWDKYGKAAGPIRNQEMLDALLDYRNGNACVSALAFHSDIESSKGTKDMIRKLSLKSIDYVLVGGR